MTSTLPTIKTTLQNGDLDTAAQQLLTFAQASHPRFASEIIGHLARLKQIATDERKGVVGADVTLMRKNQVLYALLDLIEVMEEAAKSKLSAPGAESAGAGSIVIGGNASQVIIVQGDHNVVKKQDEKRLTTKDTKEHEGKS